MLELVPIPDEVMPEATVTSGVCGAYISPTTTEQRDLAVKCDTRVSNFIDGESPLAKSGPQLQSEANDEVADIPTPASW